MIHIISLGAGVQSSTMALMAAHGEIKPMPQCAIFADTQWEPKAVYEWLAWLEKRLPFRVHRVTAGNLRAEQITARLRDGGRLGSHLPYFTTTVAGAGQVRRQCTSEYKIYPIERFMRREILKLRPRQRAPRAPVIVQWRGISADEAQRMKPSREPWMVVRYPLAMEHGMTRGDCLAWMRRHGYPTPPRSACIGCPFHSDDEWLSMKRERPDEFADAVDFDRRVRKAGGKRGDTYLHRSCVPLDQIDFEQRITGGNLDLFGNECEGMCGV